MPKTESKCICYPKGAEWSPEVETVLSSLFTPDAIKKFKEKGVRFRISAQSPFPRPKIPTPKKEIFIEPKCLQDLQDAAYDPDKLEKALGDFNGAELQELGKIYLGVKLPQKQRVEESRRMIFDALRSETVWKKIAGVVMEDGNE
ncbi:MAG: hypothetical protein M2R45_04266 [Verrucomicrobia subdivision 3 bacterium]|nr:hypothetical protein [Limisphaerales bacterium]MCS1417373.1 hypothetical protein [Limisphaerales bacterium]